MLFRKMTSFCLDLMYRITFGLRVRVRTDCYKFGKNRNLIKQ